MVKRFFLISLSLLFLYSCNENDSVQDKHPQNINSFVDSVVYAGRNNYFGMSLINGPTRGTAFTDSTETIKQFRRIRVSLANDTIIPIRLQLDFSNKAYRFPHSQDEEFKAFLLPDTINESAPGFNLFLKSILQKPSSLDTIIQPGQTFIINTGMLFNTRDAKVIWAELFFKGNSHNPNLPDTIISLKVIQSKGLDIMLGVTLSSLSTYYERVKCGRVGFLECIIYK